MWNIDQLKLTRWYFALNLTCCYTISRLLFLLAALVTRLQIISTWRWWSYYSHQMDIWISLFPSELLNTTLWTGLQIINIIHVHRFFIWNILDSQNMELHPALCFSLQECRVRTLLFVSFQLSQQFSHELHNCEKQVIFKTFSFHCIYFIVFLSFSIFSQSVRQ